MSFSRLVRASGVYASVAAIGTTAYLGYDDGQFLKVDALDGTNLWTSAAIGEALMWVRIAASPTEVRGLAMGNVTGHVYYVSSSTVTDLGASQGTPMAFEYTGGAWHAAIQLTGTTYEYGPIGSFAPGTMALTSQGFCDMIGGVPVRADDQLSRTIGSWVLARWVERTPVVGAQWASTAGAAVLLTDRGVGYTAIPDDSFEVQLILFGGSGLTGWQIGIAARTPVGAQLAVDPGPYSFAAQPGVIGGIVPGLVADVPTTTKTPRRTTAPRVYPHVTEIQDFPTQQSVRLLWDRVQALHEDVTAKQAQIDALSASHAALTTTVAGVQRDAQSALATSQQPDTATGATVVGGATGPPSSSGGTTGDTFPQPYDARKNPNPALGRTPAYVSQMVDAAFAYYRTQHPGQQPEASTTYWLSVFWGINTPDPGGSGDGWGSYWWDRIQASPGVPA